MFARFNIHFRIERMVSVLYLAKVSRNLTNILSFIISYKTSCDNI